MLILPDIEPGTAGVYFILCRTNQRVYVGQSIGVLGRWETHLTQLRHGNHPTKALQQDWRDHGEDAFEFGLLIDVPNLPHTPHSYRQGRLLSDIEQTFMRIYQSKNPAFG